MFRNIDFPAFLRIISQVPNQVAGTVFLAPLVAQDEDQKECGKFLVHNSLVFYIFYVSDTAAFGIIMNGACIWMDDNIYSKPRFFSAETSLWKFFMA